MSSKSHTEIPLENLQKLGEIYKKDWPKFIVVYSSIQTFIQRFQEFPGLKEKVKLFVLSENWENDGAFFLTVSFMKLLIMLATFNTTFSVRV